MKIIAISNQKGGCGKTTTATCLSAAFAQRGKTTLLIDLDPQAHASVGLGLLKVDPSRSVFSLFSNESDKLKRVNELIISLESNLHLIPSHILLSTIEHDLKEREDGLFLLAKSLEHLNLRYDYIVLDCPPNLGFITFNALRASDDIIIPVEASAFSIMGVGKLVSMVELIKLKLHHAPHVKGLITMYDEYADYSKKMSRKIQYVFKEKLLKTIIFYDTTVREAQERSESIYRYNPKCRTAHNYLSLADEVIAVDKEESTKSIYHEMREALRGAYGNVFSREKTFKFKAPEAKQVYVVGDFNNWQIDESSKLTKSNSGEWKRTFYLLPGKYRYKFVADGLWFWDPGNPEKKANQFGDFDSIFKV